MVVATRDRAHLLAGCLDALDDALRPGDQVLVVDSAGSDDTALRLCRERGVPALRVDLPGTSRARNVGWRASTAPLVAFTDDDCRPQPGWAQAMVDALVDGDFATGRVVADRAVAAPVSLLDDRVARVLAAPVHPGPLGASPLGRSALGHGASCAFRRDLLERLGGFDERLGPGTPGRAAEDADLLRRALAAGARGRYEPQALVVHVQWRTRGQALRLSYSYGLGASASGVPARKAVWDDGLVAAARDLCAGYLTGTAAGLLRAAGAAAGRRRR